MNYVASYFPADPNNVANARGLADLYPNQPLLGQPAGSPFRTAAFNSIYPQFKRLAAILGDITFTITRRVSTSSQKFHVSLLIVHFCPGIPGRNYKTRRTGVVLPFYLPLWHTCAGHFPRQRHLPCSFCRCSSVSSSQIDADILHCLCKFWPGA